MTYLVCDIETVGTARGLSQPYPSDRQAPSNYKDPEKITAWHLRDEAEWRAGLAKECALSPRLGRVVAIGLGNTQGGTVRVGLDESDERDLIAEAFDRMRGAPLLVTFNGLTFDLPFLHVRAAIHGVQVPAMGPILKRYSSFPHADIRAILTNWDNRTTGTLHEWCQAFGIEVTDESTGADIGAMVEQRDAEGITKHCLADIASTAQLAERMASAGLIAL